MVRHYTPDVHQTSHITVRCNNKEFLLNPHIHFESIISWLNALPLFFSVQLHHVLIMSNHLHMLVTPTRNNLGRAMSYFLTNLSKYLNYTNERNNHIFGNRYKPTVIRNKKHLINVIRYIYQNPVRAEMVQEITRYPYSSLGFYLGWRNNGLVMTPDEYTWDLLNMGTAGLKIWYEHTSEILSSNATELIKQSLKRKLFRFSTKQLREVKNDESNLIY